MCTRQIVEIFFEVFLLFLLIANLSQCIAGDDDKKSISPDLEIEIEGIPESEWNKIERARRMNVNEQNRREQSRQGAIVKSQLRMFIEDIDERVDCYYFPSLEARETYRERVRTEEKVGKPYLETFRYFADETDLVTTENELFPIQIQLDNSVYDPGDKSFEREEWLLGGLLGFSRRRVVDTVQDLVSSAASIQYSLIVTDSVVAPSSSLDTTEEGDEEFGDALDDVETVVKTGRYSVETEKTRTSTKEEGNEQHIVQMSPLALMMQKIRSYGIDPFNNRIGVYDHSNRCDKDVIAGYKLWAPHVRFVFKEGLYCQEIMQLFPDKLYYVPRGFSRQEPWLPASFIKASERFYLFHISPDSQLDTLMHVLSKSDIMERYSYSSMDFASLPSYHEWRIPTTLKESAFTLCAHNATSTCIFDALLHGSIPITLRTDTSNKDQYQGLGPVPYIRVTNWSQVVPLLTYFAQNPDELDALQAKNVKWWGGYYTSFQFQVNQLIDTSFEDVNVAYFEN